MSKMLFRRATLSLAIALICGALVAATSSGDFFPGWLASSILIFIAAFCLISAWEWAGRGRTLAWMIALAFVLRLGFGVGFTLALPSIGYADSESQNAGYLFPDAYQRDGSAWALAQSGESLLASFGKEFATDQYGGLLSLSALVYRALSPDAHRPALVLILAAFGLALGVPFFYRAVKERWNPALAGLATWILIFYPDGIFFTSSQMREPFLIGLTGIAFWGVLAFERERRSALIAIVASLGVMALISSRVAVAVIGVLAVLFWLEHLAPRSRAWKIGGLIALGLGGLAAVAYTGYWLRESAHYEFVRTMLTGNKQYWIEKVGEEYMIPFIIGLGLSQPLLPAAIADSAIPLWKTIAIVRSVGWYLLAPLLLYGIYTSIKARPNRERAVMVFFAAIIVIWTCVSAFRAGGDLTDNPRYRTIFLPWLALLAGWGVRWAAEHKDLWLARFLLVEAIFLGFFTHWYISRYYGWWGRMPLWTMLAWIGALSAAVLASGWVWEGISRLRRSKSSVPLEKLEPK